LLWEADGGKSSLNRGTLGRRARWAGFMHLLHTSSRSGAARGYALQV
jgi:hypothetical protein